MHRPWAISRSIAIGLVLALSLVAFVRSAPAIQQGGRVETAAELRAALETERALVGPTAPLDVAATLDEVAAQIDRLVASEQAAASYGEQAGAARARRDSLTRDLAVAPDTGVPPLAADATLRDVEQLAQRAEADLGAARTRLTTIATEAVEIETRGEAIAHELAVLQEQLDAASQTLAGLAPADAQTGPRPLALRVDVELARTRLSALEAERGLIEARRELLPLRRDDAQRAAARAELLQRTWQQRVSERRQTDATQAALEAQRRQVEATGSYPALAQLAERNQELAAMREGPNGLPARIDRAAAELRDLQRKQHEIAARDAGARRKVAAAGVDEALGLLMRRDAQWLPNSDELETRTRVRAKALSIAQLEQIDLEEERERAGDIGARQAELVAAMRADLGEARAAELEGIALDLVRAQREQLDTLDTELAALLRHLSDQSIVHDEISRTATAYRLYIDERVLWFPSASLEDFFDGRAHLGALEWLGSPYTWSDLLQSIWAGARVAPLRSAFAVALILAWLLSRRRARRAIEAIGTRSRSFRSDGHHLTIEAIALLVAVALPPALVPWLLVGLAALDPATSTSTLALTSAIGTTAWVAASLYALHEVARPRGMGETLFRLPIAHLLIVQKWIKLLAPPYLALLAAALAFNAREVAAWEDSLGRVVFVASQFVLIAGLRRTFKGLELWNPEGTDGGSAGRARVRRTWMLLVLVGPAAWSVLALVGYGYAALELEIYYRQSLLLGLGVALLHMLLLRWLFVARRRLAIGRAQARVQARADQGEDAGALRESSAAMSDDDIDLPAIDAQTRQFFRSILVVATMLGLYGIWSSGLPAVKVLDRVEIWPRFLHVSSEIDVAEAPVVVPRAEVAPAASGESSGIAAPTGLPLPLPLPVTDVAAQSVVPLQRVTGADIVLMLMIMLLTTVAAKNVPGLLEITLLKRLPLDGGERNALATLFRYFIIVVGSSASFGALGIGWEKVQWLAAALTFGLAFGLQEVFANFVSGIIILIERPIRVGDIVTVGGIEGRVTRLRMRATTILDWDRKELLVPNKEFITSSIVNWTLSDPITRVTVPVGVAYGSDTKLVHEILVGLAKANRTVLTEPAPQVIFRRFGADSLEFEMRVFIVNRDHWPELVHSLHMEVEQALSARGIEIAFPQRDLHIKSAPGLEALFARERAPQDERTNEARSGDSA